MLTTPLDDDTFFWNRYHTLSPARQKKIDQLIFSKDKKLSLAAGLVFQAGLADYGLQEQHLIIAHHQNGKPYLPQYPELFFNISHSEQLAICVFSNREIGADVEKVSNIDLEIARRLFDNAEYREIIAADCPEEAFYNYWVLKESYMKATGWGLKLPLNGFRIAREVVLLKDQLRVYQGSMLMPYSFYIATVFESYKLAVCTKGDQPEIKLRFL
ncbi:4'-phosphopantetheinyl transferase family protein [Acetobacterium woodii]|nr:4'-phosphopantetheinyl transferase superfamily protein [Acetobacterium woodii]